MQVDMCPSCEDQSPSVCQREHMYRAVQCHNFFSLFAVVVKDEHKTRESQYVVSDTNFKH